MKEVILEDIERELPPLINRKGLSRVLGDVVAPKTWANLDSQDLGINGRVRVRGAVAYPRIEVLRWLAENLEMASEAKKGE